MHPSDPRAAQLQPRRRFHATLLASAAAALGAGGLLATTPAGAQQLRPTSGDFEGPYRPPKGTTWGGIDRMTSRDASSPGKPLVLAGRLLDTGGRPQPGLQDAEGWFAFRTIRPGGYKRTLFGFVPWTFVPHIHVAVRAAGRDLLVTQADLDTVAARRPAGAHADHAELMRSEAMRRLVAATGSAAVAGAGTQSGAELIRFDVVLVAAA